MNRNSQTVVTGTQYLTRDKGNIRVIYTPRLMTNKTHLCTIKQWTNENTGHMTRKHDIRTWHNRCVRLEVALHRAIVVWHRSTVKYIEGRWLLMLWNRSHCTLMSYNNQSAQCRFKSNTPITMGAHGRITWGARVAHGKQEAELRVWITK